MSGGLELKRYSKQESPSSPDQVREPGFMGLPIHQGAKVSGGGSRQVEVPGVGGDNWEVGALDQREAGEMGKLSGC